MTWKHAELQYLRGVIDSIDRALIHILAGRFRVTDRIGMIKAIEDMPVGDPAREKSHIAALRDVASSCELAPEVAEAVIRAVVAEAKKRHELWPRPQVTGEEKKDR